MTSERPSAGPQLFSVSNQRHAGGGREDRKMVKRGGKKAAERKRGFNFSRVINFQSQVLTETCISFGSWPEASDLFPFPSHVTLQALACDLSGNEYTSLERDRLQEREKKNHPIKCSYFSGHHQYVWGAGPPSVLTSDMRNV